MWGQSGRWLMANQRATARWCQAVHPEKRVEMGPRTLSAAVQHQMTELHGLIVQGRVKELWFESSSTGAFALVALAGLCAEAKLALPGVLHTVQGPDGAVVSELNAAEHLHKALTTLWQAMISDSTNALRALANTDAGPWSRLAMRLHLSQLPSRVDGLCIPQRLALHRPDQALGQVLRALGGPAGPGATWFDLTELIVQMTRGRSPLLRLSAEPKARFWERRLLLLPRGEAVLQAKDVWRGPRRWIGGLRYAPGDRDALYAEDLGEG